MKIIDMTCPHCGAYLKIDSEKTQAYCEHCGAKLAIDDEVQHIQYDNAEEAGYKFEKGRQRAQEEARKSATQQYSYNTYNPTPQNNKPKRKTWLWVLGWIFFFPAPIMVLIWRKKNTWDIKVKIAVTVAFWVVFFAIGAANNDSNNTETSPTDSSTIEVSHEKETPAEAEKSVNEDTKTESGTAKEETDTVEQNVQYPLQEFVKSYIDRGRVDNIEELTKENGLYYNKKNTGVSTYYKVALTKDDAKATSLSDLTKGDYCVVINGSGESLTYYNNVDYIEILYSDDNGIALYDKSRLTPFENGTMRQEFGSIEEAFAYKTEVESDISKLEEFYFNAQIGMTADELEGLLEEYGLQKHYRRSNSDDGYISYDGVENYDYGTCIQFVLRDVLTDLDYYDYFVYNKYGLHVEYIMDSQASKRSGEYAEPGYYIVGGESPEYFETAEEAITKLHSYRLQ